MLRIICPFIKNYMPAAKHLLMQRYEKSLYKCMALRIIANKKEKERNANKSITHTILIMK